MTWKCALHWGCTLWCCSECCKSDGRPLVAMSSENANPTEKVTLQVEDIKHPILKCLRIVLETFSCGLHVRIQIQTLFCYLIIHWTLSLSLGNTLHNCLFQRCSNWDFLFADILFPTNVISICKVLALCNVTQNVVVSFPISNTKLQIV